MLRWGFLGPEATYSHQAVMEAIKLSNEGYELCPFKPIPAVLEALLAKKVDRAVVPIENLIEDVVGLTLDHLIANGGGERNQITGELILPINHKLLAKPGYDISSIETVSSHPQALGQCREFIEKHGWETKEAASTAAAAEQVAESEIGMAAIAPAIAADVYGLEIIAENISGSNNNFTRFWILGGDTPKPTGNDKTTIFFVTNDESGALYHALGAFHYHGRINLKKIDSRTRKTRLGESVFWIDAQCHQDEINMKGAIEELRSVYAIEVTVAGSYPAAK